ncbi:hypothetical protein GmHk_18G051549 [Glycine max]|nr:hypothetical protein GmHk_18G051549 [Glycine max]
MLSFSQMQSQMQSQRLALPHQPKPGPSIACVSTKESCVDPSGQDLDTGDSKKCGLYVDENPPRLVALGRVYEGSMTIHSFPLGNDQVKVGVKKVRDADAHDKQGAKGPTKLVDRLDPDVDLLYLMALTIQQLFLNPLQVSWDVTVFRVYNDSFPLYINHEDLLEIALGGQCLSISVIQLWIMHMTETSMRAGNASIYGFLEPQSIQKYGKS